jgi:hypothetical protein
VTRARALLVALAFAFVARAARADDAVVTPASAPASTPRALAMELTPAWTRLLLPAGPHAVETSHQNGGPSLVLGVTLRTGYFFAPFLEGGWFSLYSDQQRKVVPGASSAPITFDGSLSVLSVLAGASFSFSRLRLRGGVGTYSLRVSAHVLGDTLATSELDMGYVLAFGGWVWESARVRIGAELRGDFIVQASTTFATLGLTVGGDAITW